MLPDPDQPPGTRCESHFNLVHYRDDSQHPLQSKWSWIWGIFSASRWKLYDLWGATQWVVSSQTKTLTLKHNQMLEKSITSPKGNFTVFSSVFFLNPEQVSLSRKKDSCSTSSHSEMAKNWGNSPPWADIKTQHTKEFTPRNGRWEAQLKETSKNCS